MLKNNLKSVRNNNAINNSDIKTKLDKFKEVKDFYYSKFGNEKSFNKVMSIYINSTKKNELYNEYSLRCLNMYLFKKGIIYRKYTLEQLSILVRRFMIQNSEKHKKQYILEYLSFLLSYYIKELKGIKNHIKKDIEKHIEIDKIHGKDYDIKSSLMFLASKIGFRKITKRKYLAVIYDILRELKVDYGINSINDLKIIVEDMLYITNIYYFNKDESKLYKTEAIFNERYILVRYGNNISQHRLSKRGLIDVKIDELESPYDYALYSVNIKDVNFVAKKHLKDKIVDYYNEYNIVVLNKMKKDKELINNQIENVSEKVIKIITNFYDYIPKTILLDRNDYMVFEHIVSFKSYYSKLVVDINSYERDNAINKIENNEDYYVQFIYFSKNIYKKLVKVIGKYLDLDEGIHSSITWGLIKKYAPKYFTEKWIERYNFYFDNIENKSIDELVSIYCKINEINPKDIHTVGIFTYYLMYNNKFEQKINSNFLKCNKIVIKKLLKKLEQIELKQFEKKLLNDSYNSPTYTIDDIDLMTGYEFENFIRELFKKMGYSAKVTKGSGDQGIDVLVEKNGKRIGVQAKRYSKRVTNKAIQEVVAGLNYYNCEKGMVVTNNYFTDSALELAEANNIVLWDRNMLKLKINNLVSKLL